MDPLSAAGMILPVVTGVAGEMATADERNKAMQEEQRALLMMLGLDPDELAIEAGQAANTADEDPRLKEAGMGALRQMQGMASAGGMDPQSQATLMQAQSQSQQAERGSREALNNNMAARGISGSGIGLAQSMLGQQEGATRNHMAGTLAAGDARSRALTAMQATGTMAGSIRGDDSRHSAAQDAINKFNANNRQGADQFNTGMEIDVTTAKSGALNEAAARKRAEVLRLTKQFNGVGQGAQKSLGGASKLGAK